MGRLPVGEVQADQVGHAGRAHRRKGRRAGRAFEEVAVGRGAGLHRHLVVDPVAADARRHAHGFDTDGGNVLLHGFHCILRKGRAGRGRRLRPSA
ncbi:Uncharacterised protein [Bordetella pertussis]|nr:Uncharacterised protein [Bordetella pertussis]